MPARSRFLRRAVAAVVTFAAVGAVAGAAGWLEHANDARAANEGRIADANGLIDDLDRTITERMAQLDIASSFVESSYPADPNAFEKYLASYRMATNFTDLSLSILIAAVTPEQFGDLEAQEREWNPTFTVYGDASSDFGGYQLVLLRTPRGADELDRRLLGLNVTPIIRRLELPTGQLEVDHLWLFPMGEAARTMGEVIGEANLQNRTIATFLGAEILAMQRLEREDGTLLGWFIVPVRADDLLAMRADLAARVRVTLLDPGTGAEMLSTPLADDATRFGLLADRQFRAQGVAWRVEVFAEQAPQNTVGIDSMVASVVLAGELAALVVLGTARRLLRRRRALLAELHESTRQATTDYLTKIPNRNGLEREVDAMLADGRTGSVYVMLLDVDRFKLVNDTQGHEVGDVLLRSISARLRDEVGRLGVIARFGGDEFVFATAQLADDAAALACAERIHEAVAQPLLLADGEHLVTVSIGIASAAAGSPARAGELLRDADVAMYRAKRSQNMRSAIFDPAMRHEAIRLLEVEKELRAALRSGEIVPYFQPIFDRDGGLVAFEALARWMHPDRGLVLPGQFLDVAASVGCLPELDRQILRRACEQAALWNADRTYAPVQMFVNLAEEVLLAPNFAHDVEAALAASGLAAHLLTLEISEDLVLGRLGGDFAELRELAALGVQLAIDDFGRGRSSLLALADLDMVTVLKLDREFVRKLPTHEPTRRVFAAVRDVAHSLDMRLIGEGVETEDEARALSDLGIDCVQGYLFGHPMPMPRAAELVREARGGERVVVDLRSS